MEKALQMIIAQMNQPILRDVSESSVVSADQMRRAVDGDTVTGGLPPELQEDRATQIPQSEPYETFPSSPWGNREYRPPRMELPLFSGDNPEGWIYRAERYFLLSRMSETHMLETAIIGLE